MPTQIRTEDRAAWSSGPRHQAGWVVGPIAVERDDAPMDAPGYAEPASVLADRVMERVPYTIGNDRYCAAETTRNGMRRG